MYQHPHITGFSPLRVRWVPVPALSRIGLCGVAVPSCHILSFLNTSGFHGWVRPSEARLSALSSVAHFRFATVRLCRGHGTDRLYSLAFLRKSHLKVYKGVEKTSVFRCPPKRDGLHARRRHATPTSRGEGGGHRTTLLSTIPRLTTFSCGIPEPDRHPHNCPSLRAVPQAVLKGPCGWSLALAR